MVATGLLQSEILLQVAVLAEERPSTAHCRGSIHPHQYPSSLFLLIASFSVDGLLIFLLLFWDFSFCYAYFFVGVKY